MSLLPGPSRSHRPALMAFHDLVLSLDGEGGWSLHPGHRSLEAKQEAAAHAGAKGGVDTREGPGMPTPSQPDSCSGKARGSDAEAVLQGMTAGKRRRQRGRGKQGRDAQEEAEEELGDGNEGFSGPAHSAGQGLLGSEAASRGIQGLHLPGDSTHHGSMLGSEQAVAAAWEGGSISYPSCPPARWPAELVIARAPPASAADRRLQAWAPRMGLKPAKLSSIARWKVGRSRHGVVQPWSSDPPAISSPAPPCCRSNCKQRGLPAAHLLVCVPQHCWRDALVLLHPSCHLAPLQSVLAILSGDRQWLVRVSSVAGVVVLRTLLQVRGLQHGGVWAGARAGSSQPLVQPAMPHTWLSVPTLPGILAGPHCQPEWQECGPGVAAGPARLCAVSWELGARAGTVWACSGTWAMHLCSWQRALERKTQLADANLISPVRHICTSAVRQCRTIGLVPCGV